MENLPSFDEVEGEAVVIEDKLPSFDEVEGEATVIEEPTVAPQEQSTGSKVLEYMTVPEADKQPKSEAYKEGYEGYTKPELKPVPKVAPEMEQNTLTGWFTGRNYDVESINAFMDYNLANGMTKNEAIKELKSKGASALDLQTAIYAVTLKGEAKKGRDLSTEEAIQTHIIEPAARGYMRTRFATKGLANEINKKLGLDTTEDEAELDRAKGAYKASKENYSERMGMDSPLEYLPEIATFAISGGGALAVGGKEMLAEFVISKGDGFSNGQSLARAVTVGLIAGGATRLLDGPTTVAKGKLTSETENLLEFAGIKKGSDEYKDLANQALQVDPDDQARIVAEQLGADDLGFKTQALRGAEDEVRRDYAKVMAERTSEVSHAIGLDDFPAIKETTQAQYDTMREVAKNVSLGKYYNVNTIADKLKAGKNAFLNTPAEGRVDKLIAKIEDMPSMALDDVIDIRQAINYEYGKTTDKYAKRMLTELKADVDTFMKDAELPPSVFQMVEDSTKSYHRMKSQEEIMGYMEKAQVSLGKGSLYGEITITDWNKLNEILKKEGVSKIVQDEAELFGEMAKKYGGSEKELLQKSRPAGEAENIGAIIAESPEGFARTSLTQRAIETIQRWMPVGDKGKKLRIQKAIRDSMAKAKTYPEFAENLIKDKNVPMKIKAETQKYLDEFEDILGETGATTKAESQYIIKKAEKMKLRVDKAETSARKTKVGLDNAHTRTAQLERMIDEANEAGDDELVASLSDKLLKHKETTVKIAEQRYNTARRAHSMLKEDYDAFASKHSTAFENAPPFETALKGAERPPRTNAGKGDKPTPANEEPPTFVSAGLTRPPSKPYKATPKPRGKMKPKPYKETPIGEYEDTTALPAVAPMISGKAGNDTAFITRPFHSEYGGREQISSAIKSGKRETVGSWKEGSKDSRFTAEGEKPRLPTGYEELQGSEVAEALGFNNKNTEILSKHWDNMTAPQQKLVTAILKDNPDMAITEYGSEYATNLKGLERGYGGVGGVSRSSTGQVVLPKGSGGSKYGADTYLHEIVHQATVNRYMEDEIFRNDIDKLFKYAKAHTPTNPKGRDYWQTNSKEFLAEGFSNAKVAEDLAQIPAPQWLRDKYPSSGIKNLWDAFVKMVSNSFGRKEQDSVFDLMGDMLASNVGTAPKGFDEGTKFVKSSMDMQTPLDSATDQLNSFMSGGLGSPK